MYNDEEVIQNEVFKTGDGFELINADLWDIVQAPGDIVELGGNSAGSGYLKISKDPLTDDTETVLVSKFTVSGPFRAALGAKNCKEMSRPVAKIASATKAGSTTATIVTDGPHDLK